jgi:hypothetical protein
VLSGGAGGPPLGSLLSAVASEKPQTTIGCRMSLDETLDIGEDTGTLDKVTINISEQELTEEQLQNYREQRARGATSH